MAFAPGAAPGSGGGKGKAAAPLSASPVLGAALRQASFRAEAARSAAAPEVEPAAAAPQYALASPAGKDNAEVGLPPGWAAHWSNSQAAWYWLGPGGVSTWEKPQPASLVVDDPSYLPDGWVEVFSKSRNLPYYRNKQTGETSWERPT